MIDMLVMGNIKMCNSMSTAHISIVSPVYKGEKMVTELVRRNVEGIER